MQNKICFWYKIVVARFDKKNKIATRLKKSIDESKNLLSQTLKKKTLSLVTQRIPYQWDTKENPINEKPKEYRYQCET